MTDTKDEKDMGSDVGLDADPDKEGAPKDTRLEVQSPTISITTPKMGMEV